MAADTPITLVGNLVDDPVLRHTASGVPVAGFRVASTPRVYDRDSGQWKDGQTLFMSCSAWRQQAQNVVATCRRGTRVVVLGRLRQRSYETAEGTKRVVWEVDADEVGASLRHASGELVRNSQGPGGAQQRPDPSGDAGGPWRQQIDSRTSASELPARVSTPVPASRPVPASSPVSSSSPVPAPAWAPPEGFDSWAAYPPLEDGDEPPF